MLVSTARQIARDGALQASLEAYDNTKVDLALMYVGNDFIEHAPLVETTGTVATDSTATTISIPLTDFDPQRLIRVEFGTHQQLAHVNYRTVAEKLERVSGTANGTQSTSTPSMIAFYASGTSSAGRADSAIIDCPAGTQYPTLTLFYKQSFTAWSAGSSVAGTTLLNIPDKYAYAVFHDGASAVLQLNDPDARFGSVAWQRYEKWRDFVAGKAGNDNGVFYSSRRNFI